VAKAFIYLYANVMTDNFGRCVMRLDQGDLSSDALTEVRAYKRRIDRSLRTFLEEGIRDGSVQPCDPKLAAFSIAGAVNWICMWYQPTGSHTPQEIASQFAWSLTQGLARRSGRVQGPRKASGARNGASGPARARKARNQESKA
jgi:hypothetical protein